MGIKEENQDTTTTTTATTNKKLSIKVPPSFFRCPISLDVMKSPVSLCTGVTYDRSSIQRWLDSGNTTCPATMQPLPSTDLIPNLTLHRLINLWRDLPLPSKLVLEDIRSSADPVPPINKFFDIICSNNDDDNSTLLGPPAGAALILASKLADQPNNLRVAEPLVALVSKILTLDQPCRRPMVSALAAASLYAAVSSSLLSVLKDGSSLGSRNNAAAVLGAVINGDVPINKVTLAEKPDLIPELVRLASHEPLDRAAVEAALSCLVGLSEVRRARFRMVRLGIVSLSTRVLRGQEKAVGPAAAEKALKLLEVASGCSDGREEICELGERCIGAVLGRMMKVGKEGTESGVAVLWSVCHLFRDRRAQEAVAAANGGLTKILLLMQSDCSPAVRQMTGDLLKIFRVNSKSCLSGYDTKTTHIMPF